jgi:UPF0716 protein FxsA
MRAFAIFVFYVVLELLVAIWVASLVGWLLVIGLTIAGFVLGITVMSSAGTSATIAIREASESGRAPEGAVARSATRFTAGVLIMVPGFITDAVGLLLLIPPIGKLAGRLGLIGFARWARKQNFSIVTTTQDGATFTRVVPGDVVVGDVIRTEDEPTSGSTRQPPPNPSAGAGGNSGAGRDRPAITEDGKEIPSDS